MLTEFYRQGTENPITQYDKGLTHRLYKKLVCVVLWHWIMNVEDSLSYVKVHICVFVCVYIYIYMYIL
jgi:hypothetical protein